MSIIFGVRKDIGAVVSKESLLALGTLTFRWAQEGTQTLTKGRVGMGTQPYRTHERSHLEDGPICDAQGNMLCLDGRLDNHVELRVLLGITDTEASDAYIVLAAFRRWEEQAFSKLVGDWSVALWSEREQSLYLVRDHAGTRSLYFEERGGAIRWSTFLESFFGDNESKSLNNSYIASYLLSESFGDRTPYVGIKAVAPGNIVVFRKGRTESMSHWRCLPSDTLRYANDRDYEEHFLTLLKQAVGRRTVPGAPILAHLSGGMDSSTIICVSDLLRTEPGWSEGLLDTVSFFDDTEPSWNERPYFAAVEMQRGKCGLHIDVSEARPTFEILRSTETGSPLLPGLDAGKQGQMEEFNSRIANRGYRTILSGLGGDELLGGVPTPLPELSDYLFHGTFSTLWRSTLEWALVLRKPVLHLLWDSVCFSANAYRGTTFSTDSPPWVIDIPHRKDRRVRPAKKLGGRPKCRWESPSALITEQTWWKLLETLPNAQLALGERREYRFPYLDRDLVDFLIRVPNDQLVRPGRRRSLMRRALYGIVPEKVLERRRKGFLSRNPMYSITLASDRMREIMSTSLLADNGHIDRKVFDDCLRQVTLGVESRWVFALTRTCLLELWLMSGAAAARMRSEAAFVSNFRGN